MHRVIEIAALLIVTASASSPSLRGQEVTQLDDMEVDASVLRDRTEAEFEERRRQLQGAGATIDLHEPILTQYSESFSTPLDSHSIMVVRGKCVQWVQKVNQLKAIIPPGAAEQNEKMIEISGRSRLEKFGDFDFNQLCSREERESGYGTGDCGEMLKAVRSLGTAALGKARFCELTQSVPCSVPSKDDVTIRVACPQQPFGNPDCDFKVKSVAFENCSMKIDFKSASNRMSAWSTVEITALFPPPGTVATN